MTGHILRACDHGLTVVSEVTRYGYTIQHGDNPEARRFFSAREIAEHGWTEAEAWIKAVHQYADTPRSESEA